MVEQCVAACMRTEQLKVAASFISKRKNKKLLLLVVFFSIGTVLISWEFGTDDK
jgi:hypothetical protein